MRNRTQREEQVFSFLFSSFLFLVFYLHIPNFETLSSSSSSPAAATTRFFFLLLWSCFVSFRDVLGLVNLLGALGFEMRSTAWLSYWQDATLSSRLVSSCLVVVSHQKMIYFWQHYHSCACVCPHVDCPVRVLIIS